jgi:hypothetical protein
MDKNDLRREFERARASAIGQAARPRSSGRYTCLHCGNPFNDGVVTSQAAICDICNGD